MKGINLFVGSLGSEPLLTQTNIDYSLQESDCGAINLKDDHFSEDVVQDTLRHKLGESISGDKDNLFSLLSIERILIEDTRKDLSKEFSNFHNEGFFLSDVKE